MALESGFYIMRGFTSRSDMQVNGYEIKNMPIQTDQRDGRQWLRPGNEADIVRPAALVDTIGGRRFPYGGITFFWPMVNLSPKMTLFLHEEIFNLNWYAEVTVQTFNRATGEWETYHATARWPDYVNEAEIAGGGFNNFKINFVNGVAAPQGPDLVTAGSAEGNFTIDGIGTYIVDVSNIGDASTFESVQVDAFIVNGLVFVNQSATGWDFTWSQDGLSYSTLLANPPNALSEIRYVRWVRSDELSPNETYPSIALSINLASGGVLDTTFSITAEGDISSGNNSITFSADISASAFDNGFSDGFAPGETAFDTGFSFGFGPTPDGGFDNGFNNGFGANPETI